MGVNSINEKHNTWNKPEDLSHWVEATPIPLLKILAVLQNKSDLGKVK